MDGRTGGPVCQTRSESPLAEQRHLGEEPIRLSDLIGIKVFTAPSVPFESSLTSHFKKSVFELNRQMF